MVVRQTTGPGSLCLVTDWKCSGCCRGSYVEGGGTGSVKQGLIKQWRYAGFGGQYVCEKSIL